MARRLYVDISTNRFVQGVDNGTTGSLGSLFQNDTLDVELYFLQPNATGETVYEPLDWSAKSVKMHIGQAPPSTATAYVAADSWTNLGSTVAATVTRTVTGATNANEVQKIEFSPEAFDGTFAITIPNRTLTLTSISAGVFTTSGNHGLTLFEPFVITGTTTPSGFSNGSGLFVAQLVSSNQFYAATTQTTSAVTAFSAAAAGSIYTLTATTRLLPARATALDVEQALDALPSVGTDNVSVFAVSGKEYRLGFSGSKGQVELPLATVAASLTPIYGKTSSLSLATQELGNAISASSSLGAVVEIEVLENSISETVLQQPVTIFNDIITSVTAAPVPTISPASSFNLTSPDASVWNVTIDNSGVLTVQKI